MMPFYYDHHMSSGYGVFAFLLCLVIFVDLILAGVWLLQHISKK
jgi:hypothetical protein